MPTDELW